MSNGDRTLKTSNNTEALCFKWTNRKQNTNSDGEFVNSGHFGQLTGFIYISGVRVSLTAYIYHALGDGSCYFYVLHDAICQSLRHAQIQNIIQEAEREIGQGSKLTATFAAWAQVPQSANAAGPRFLISQHIFSNLRAFDLAFCNDLSKTERQRLDKVLSDRAQEGAPVFQFSKDEAIRRAEEYALLVLHGDTQFDEKYLIVVMNMFQNILGFVFLEEVYVCSEGQEHDLARSTFMHQTSRNLIPEGAKLILPLHWCQPRDCPNDFHFNSVRLPGVSVSPLVPMQALLQASPDFKSLSTGPQAFASGPPAGFSCQQQAEASESEKPAFLFFMQYCILASETVGSEKIRILHETVRTSLATYLEKIAEEGLVYAAGFGSARFRLTCWIRRRKAVLRKTTQDLSRRTVAAIVAKAEGCTLQCEKGTRAVTEAQFEVVVEGAPQFIRKSVTWAYHDGVIPTSTKSGAGAGGTLQLEAAAAGGAAPVEATISSAGESIPGAAAPADVPAESTAGAAASVAPPPPGATAALSTEGGDPALVADSEAACGANTAAQWCAGEGSALGVVPSLPGAEPETAPLRTLPAADPVPRKSNTSYPTWFKFNAGPCGLSTGSSYAQALDLCGCPGARASLRSGGDATPAMCGAPGAGGIANTFSDSRSAPGVPGVADRFPASEAMWNDLHNHTRDGGDDADSSLEEHCGHGPKKQRAIQKPQHQRPPGIPKGSNNRVKPGSLPRPRARPVPKRHECSGSPPPLTDLNSQVEHHVALGWSGGDAARDCVMHGAKQPEQEVYNIPSRRSYSSLDAQVESSADVEMKDGLHVGGSKMDDELGGKFAPGNADVNMEHNADVNMEHNTDKRVEDDLGTSGLRSADSNSSGIRIEISLVYDSQKSVLTVQCALRKVITMFMMKHAIQGIVMAQDNYVLVHGCFSSSQLRGGKDFRFRFSKSVRAIENVRCKITFEDVTEQEVYGEVELDPAQITAPSRCWLRRRCRHNLEEQLDNSADLSNNSEDQLNTPAPNLYHTANTPNVKSPKIVDRSFVYKFGEDLAYLTELYVLSESASEFGHACMEALKLMYSVHDHLLHTVTPDGRDRSACRPCHESRTLDFSTGGTPLPTPSSCRQPKPRNTCSAPQSNNSLKCAAEWAALKSPATVLCSPQTTAESPAERPTHIGCGLMDVDPIFVALAADFEARLNARKQKRHAWSGEGRMVNLRLPSRQSFGPSSSSAKASHSTVRRRRHRLGGIRNLYHRMLAEVHRERAQDFASDDKAPSGTSPGSEGSLDESADSDAAKAVGAEESSTAADAEADAAEAAAAKARAAAAETIVDAMHSGSLKCARKLRAKHDKSSDASKDIRARLKAVAAGLVDDCTPAMRKMLAEDPRIAQRTIKSQRSFEKQVIRKYKEELRAKRKNETVLMSAAADLALGSCSSKAYATVRKILTKMNLGFALPQVKDLSAARKEHEKLQKEDLQMFATADGWMISPRAAVEMEILRMMQVTSLGSRKESGARSVGVEPERNLWQDHYHIKITLDARRITKKTSQTEVMLVFIPKDQEGVERCQKAVYYRTIGVWTGKDSRDSVERNLIPFLREIESLEKNGVLYSEISDSLLGVWETYKDLKESEFEAKGLHKINTTIWCCADMAALCALLGHGCAGDHFCSHCMTHRDERHIPYSLLEVPRDISFQALAQEHDMFPKTLYAINAMVDHAGVQGLTARGLQVCTAAAAPDLACAPDTSLQSGPALSNITIQGGCRGLRAGGGERKLSAGKGQGGDAKVPDAPALKRLVGWRSDHKMECLCDLCKVPAGTVVRVIPVTGFVRKSEFLAEHWPSHSLARLPFCALHCLMRITEALFQNICQMALKHKEPVIDRMNRGLTEAGICRQYKKIIGSDHYEKVTFEGHQALRLIRKDEAGVMEIEKILRLMWPSGDAPDGDEHYDGVRYVQRTVVLWEQWSKVVQLMSERDPSKLRLNVIDSEDGFKRFGKECREFMFRYQSMFCQEHCRSYYLHTLLHHAGEFMRELERAGMCLGMVSNSGAERRHEYGRRAARKALAGGCWRNKNPDLKLKANLFAYLTLKEILIWQHGTDLISHEMATRALRWCKDPSKLGGATAAPNSSSVEFTVQSRRALTQELLAAQTGCDKKPEDVMMTREELEAEFDLDPELEESSRLSRFESGKRHWQKIEPDDDAKYALIGILYEGERTEDVKLPPGVKADGSKLVYEIEDDRELFNNRDWDVLSEISDENSADGDEDDSEERWRLTVNSFDFRDDDDCDGDYKPGPADDSDSEVELWDARPRKSKRLRSCEGQSVQASASQKIDTPAGVPCCVRGTSVNQLPQPLIMMKQTLAEPLDARSSDQAIPCMPASKQNLRISLKQTLTVAHKEASPCMPAPKPHRISRTPARSKNGRP